MDEVQEHVFEHKELVEALIKHKSIREGLWMLTVRFGLSATNVERTGDSGNINPAAIVPVLNVGIRRTDTMTSLTVDAAEVNPAVGQKKAKKKPSSKAIKN